MSSYRLLNDWNDDDMPFCVCFSCSYNHYTYRGKCRSTVLSTGKCSRFQRHAQDYCQAREFGGRSFTSARLRTLGLADIDLTRPYVRLEARIQVPSGPSKGPWPAFWMLPSNFETSQWPLGGELDIMECIGREPNHVSRILLVRVFPGDAHLTIIYVSSICEFAGTRIFALWQ